MLGLTLSEQQWSWNASGKHPVAKDFIRLGRIFPQSVSMSEWVDKGYLSAKGSLKTGRQPRFWRLWARGAVSGELVCGVLRDSSDSIGREYPFLVLGSGRISSWEENWDLLPGACEKAWNRIEYLCTRNSIDIAGLERELGSINHPEADWRDYRTTRESVMKALSQSESIRMINTRLKSFPEKQELRMVFDMEISDHLIIASHILDSLKAAGRGAPNTVFIGGTFDETSLVMYWRPLAVEDFLSLWG